MAGTIESMEKSVCTVCDAPVDSESSHLDIDGKRYCTPCYNKIRRTNARSEGPQFRCLVCGNSLPADKLSEFQGKTICTQCLAHRNGDGAISHERDADGSEAAPPPVGDVEALLDEALPTSILPKLPCPHCWETFSPSDLLWVSQHAELLGDPVLGSETSLRFRPSRFNAQGEAIDAREMACQQLACPRCHLVVPRAIVETEPLFLSIVGAPASGKSHFLAAMCWELRRILPDRFGVAFNDADTLTNHSLNSYEEVLFLQTDTSRLVAIRKTELQGELYDQVRLGQQVISLPRPFLFTLRPAPLTRGGSAPVRLMCLYDNAGEHFQPGMDTASSPGTQHLSRSRAILFLFDPTQHPRFREACQKISQDPQLFGAARNLRQEVILNEAAARVRRYTGLSAHLKHQRPVVIVVSKADVWSPLLGVNLKREPLINATKDNPVNLVDVARIEKVSQGLRAMLMKWTPEFVAAAEEFARYVIYIPASALGHAPELEEKTGMLGVRPRDLQPRWVTVPLLYCLAKWTKGILPTLPKLTAAPDMASS